MMPNKDKIHEKIISTTNQKGVLTEGIKIGITGGVGSGKSLVLDYLKHKYHCELLIADDIGNEVKLKGNRCYEPIVELLGKEILGEDGEIVKSRMAAKVFASKELLNQVNEIIHPAVYDEIQDRMEIAWTKGVTVCVVEAALMIEAGYRSFLDEIWYVHCNEETRRIRLRETRGYSDEKIDQILAVQLKESDFIANSDRIIENDSSVEEVYKQIDQIMGELLCRM